METDMKVITGLATMLALAGCAQVQTLPTNGKSATMDLEYSQGGSGIMQSWGVVAYEDPRCEKEEKGVRLSKGAAAAPVTLPANRPVTLTFGYSDVRLGAGAGCVYSLSFTPAENHQYKARFAIIDNAASCKAEITDRAGQPVAVTLPAQACMSGVVARAVPNGEGSISVSRPPTILLR
jgi:hypothetical protein